MRFEFKNNLLTLTLNKAYEKINHALIDVFARRAHEIYGPGGYDRGHEPSYDPGHDPGHDIGPPA